MLEGGIRKADIAVDQIAPALFETEDMRAGLMGCFNTAPGNFATRLYSTVAS